MDMCPDGMMFSRAFQMCQICPQDTFSRSGDITCTHCPPNRYAPQRSATCFQMDRVGGILRLDADYSNFMVEDWQRELAVMLDTEADRIEIILTRPGSVIIYFDILDPRLSDTSRDDSPMRKLAGNQKMLLFYQWWLQGDERIRSMSATIVDFKTYTYRLLADSRGAATDDVITLFVSNDDNDAILPPQPIAYGDNENRFNPQSTYFLTVSVDESTASRCTLMSSWWFVLTTLFFSLQLSQFIFY